MIIFLVGENQELLTSLVQQVVNLEVRTFGNVWAMMGQLSMVPAYEKCLVFFDINYPVDHFDRTIPLIKNKFPQVSLWAIFDSDSPSLKGELVQMGFEKILSYRDDLTEILHRHPLDA